MIIVNETFFFPLIVILNIKFSPLSYSFAHLFIELKCNIVNIINAISPICDEHLDKSVTLSRAHRIRYNVIQRAIVSLASSEMRY